MCGGPVFLCMISDWQFWFRCTYCGSARPWAGHICFLPAKRFYRRDTLFFASTNNSQAPSFPTCQTNRRMKLTVWKCFLATVPFISLKKGTVARKHFHTVSFMRLFVWHVGKEGACELFVLAKTRICLPTSRRPRKALLFIKNTRKSSSLARRLRQNGNEREREGGGGGGGVGSWETSSKTNWLEGPHWIKDTDRFIKKTISFLDLLARTNPVVKVSVGE